FLRTRANYRCLHRPVDLCVFPWRTLFRVPAIHAPEFASLETSGLDRAAHCAFQMLRAIESCQLLAVRIDGREAEQLPANPVAPSADQLERSGMKSYEAPFRITGERLGELPQHKFSLKIRKYHRSRRLARLQSCRRGLQLRGNDSIFGALIPAQGFRLELAQSSGRGGYLATVRQNVRFRYDCSLLQVAGTDPGSVQQAGRAGVVEGWIAVESERILENNSAPLTPALNNQPDELTFEVEACR